MHDTLCKDVKGYLETMNPGLQTGWCFHIQQGVLPCRLRDIERVQDLSGIDRSDVGSYYKRPAIQRCGFQCQVEDGESPSIEMLINGIWIPIFHISYGVLPLGFGREDLFPQKRSIPSFIVVDNFYEHPDAIRNYALRQTFKDSPAFHKGKRCLHPTFRFDGLKERFETILGVKIKDWHKYGTNGCFQYCMAGDQAVYHTDTQQYAGVLFLTPDAPPETGTRFYRSKKTLKMKAGPAEQQAVFPTGYLDSTPFDQVDVVGNVYNRLVLFDAQLIHAAPLYFGNMLQNSRLFQLFFFDLDL